jgi:hypothetical protein
MPGGDDMSEPCISMWLDWVMPSGAPCVAANIESGGIYISLSQLEKEAPDWYVDAIAVEEQAPPLFQNGMGDRRRSQRIYRKAPIVVELNRRAQEIWRTRCAPSPPTSR